MNVQSVKGLGVVEGDAGARGRGARGRVGAWARGRVDLFAARETGHVMIDGELGLTRGARRRQPLSVDGARV
jgi:hypothetical protein